MKTYPNNNIYRINKDLEIEIFPEGIKIKDSFFSIPILNFIIISESNELILELESDLLGTVEIIPKKVLLGKLVFFGERESLYSYYFNMSSSNFSIKDLFQIAQDFCKLEYPTTKISSEALRKRLEAIFFLMDNFVLFKEYIL